MFYKLKNGSSVVEAIDGDGDDDDNNSNDHHHHHEVDGIGDGDIDDTEIRSLVGKTAAAQYKITTLKLVCTFLVEIYIKHKLSHAIRHAMYLQIDLYCAEVHRKSYVPTEKYICVLMVAATIFIVQKRHKCSKFVMC